MGKESAAFRHLGELLGYAATKPRHDHRDAVVADELLATARGLDLPPGLELTWLGVAGISLRYQDTTVLIDPYVTRLSLGELLGRRPVVADLGRIEAHVPRADAILLGHTHFDHALDAPAVARRDGCPVYGGASARRLLTMYGLGDRAVEVEPHRTYEIGPFAVTFVPSQHAKLALGLSVPQGGEITCDHVDELTPRSFCCGQVWGIHLAVAGRTFYHQGSADLVDDEIRHRDIDYFLCGVAGRQVTERYLPRVLGRLQPTRVLAIHQDDFFRSPDGPIGFAFGVDVARFPEEVAAVTSEIEVSTLPFLETLRGAARDEPAGTRSGPSIESAHRPA